MFILGYWGALEGVEGGVAVTKVNNSTLYFKADSYLDTFALLHLCTGKSYARSIVRGDKKNPRKQLSSQLECVQSDGAY